MRYFAPLIALLPAAILAAPADLKTRDVEACAPTKYTLSNYHLVYSAESAKLDFTFTSTFADPSIIEDAVIVGASCTASGATIPNSNECNVPGRNLLFDLAGAQGSGRYQVIHTWKCNGQTWMSSNPVVVSNAVCEHDSSTGVTDCQAAESLTVAPANVRQICSTPTCP